MAIVKIQHRRGNYADYDPTKVLPGELVVTQADDPNSSDGKAVYIGTTSGDVKQLATVDELHSEVETTVHDAMNTELMQEIDDVWREAIASEIQTGSWPEAIASEIESKTETAWRETIDNAVEDATQAAEDAADRAESAAQTLVIDTTLTQTGQAAEAKAVGDQITTLNSSLSNVIGAQSGPLNNVDANNIINAGVYQVGTVQAVTNLPSGAQYGVLRVTRSRSYIYQEYIEVASLRTYIRSSHDSGANWSAWTKVPTNAEYDELNSRYLYFTDTNSTADGSTASDRFKASMQRVLTTFAATSPTVNKTYPIMCVFSGSSGGTFNGTLNVTASAMRFFITYNGDSYAGTFNRGSSTISPWYAYPTRAEVDALNSNMLGSGQTLLDTYVTQAESLNIPNYTNYRGLFVMVMGDSNNGVSVFIPKGLYVYMIPLSLNSKNNALVNDGTGYVVSVQGHVQNGTITITSVYLSGWTRLHVLAFGVN